MQAIFDGILAFLAAVGLVSLAFLPWRHRRRNLMAHSSVPYALIAAKGDGSDLQPLLWQLSHPAPPPVQAVLLLDLGLDNQGKQAASRLARDHSALQIHTLDTLSTLFSGKPLSSNHIP